MPKYTSRQQLLSTRTVAEIAKQVHHAETPKLIFRQYLYGAYNPTTNYWQEISDDTELVHWESDKNVCVSQIRHVDMATLPNVAVVDTELTMRDETDQALEDGTNIVMPQFPMNGRRSSDTIAIYAVSALVRLRVVRINPSIYQDKVKFKFGFYSWTKIDASGYLDNNDEPNPKALIRWKPFGYSFQLDDIESGPNYQGLPYASQNLNMIMNSEKSKTLVQKEETVNISSISGSVNMKVVRIYKEFKDPIIIKYDPTTQDGAKHLNKKIFFTILSDLPEREVLNIQPYVQVCSKIYYTDIL